MKDGTVIITCACDNQEKLVWSLFKRKLSAHFGSYHRAKKHDNGWALYTCRSPFDDIDRSTAVLDAFNASVDTRGTYVAQCDGQGRIAESEEDFFKRILGFFHPVLRSLCEKSKECYERVSGRLVAWREDLNMNEGATRDARNRRTALDTPSLYYGHDETGNLWVCLGRGEPSAHAEAIRDQDGSDPSLMASVLWSIAGRRAIYGQDDSSVPLITSPLRLRARREAIHGQDGSGASLTTSPPRTRARRGPTHGQGDNDAHTRTNNNHGDLDAQLRPIPHLISGRELRLFTAQSAGGRSL